MELTSKVEVVKTVSIWEKGEKTSLISQNHEDSQTERELVSGHIYIYIYSLNHKVKYL